MSAENITPLILIDFKKHRIRIHRNTLQALGNPEYVLLLVNPGEGVMALAISDRSNPRAHHISWSAVAHKKSFELYSMTLLDNLKPLGSWDENQVYRIHGTVVHGHGVVQFRISDSFPYNNETAHG